MNAQQLKNAILQEAIEGRLVPQDPNDEPASALLERIRKEKERLVKEGKLKKKDLVEKPISEDEVPFDIPGSWEWVRLGAITTVLGGKRIPAGRKLSQSNTGHVYIRVSDMKDDIVSMDNLQYVPEDIFPSISRYIINKEDVFITVAGTIGRIGKIPPELDGANLTENADRLVFTIIDQDWLIKCLQSVIVQSQISAVTTQVGQPKLAILRIQNLLIPLPPVEEQKRIVVKIEELLPKIEEYGKAQDALNKLNAELPERLKKSILQEAIEGRLVPQDPNDEPASVLLNRIREEKQQLVKEGKLKKKDLIETPITEDEIPFEIPESWEWVRLGYVSKLLGGFAFKSHEYTSEGSRVIRISDISEKGFVNNNIVRHSYNENLNQYVIYPKDILMAMTGGTVGKSLFVNTVPEEKMLLNQRVALIRCYDILVDYIDYVIKSNYIQSIISDSKNSTNDNISMADIFNFMIPLPPLAEQHRIVEKLEQLLGEVDKLKK